MFKIVILISKVTGAGKDISDADKISDVHDKLSVLRKGTSQDSIPTKRIPIINGNLY